jgi:hypothetical protein
MKSYKSILIIGIGLVTLMAACKKSETFPVDKVNISYVFNPLDSAGTNAQAYLLYVYSVLKSGHNRVDMDYLDAASDDAVASASGRDVTLLSTGGYSAVNFPASENYWSGTNSYNTYNYWSGIRFATEFVDNIGVVPVKGSTNGVGTRWIWQSEARFLRAYYYFELVKRWGGVPLLGNTVYNINDNLLLPRNNFADCITYIVNELDAIKDSLLTVPLGSPSQDNYRATKGAALALKAKVLLYAASPLYNNSSNSNPLLGYVGYSASRWALAASAAEDVIALGSYSLDSVYRNVFTTYNDPEVIFIRTVDNGHSIENTNGPVGFGSNIGDSNTSPTQDLVNAFPMINGLAITDPNSGYNPNNPYANRDPRLASTVLCNGAPWLDETMQTYVGGQNNPQNGQQETVTGYYMRKFMGPQETSATYQNHDEDWVIFRYAEILLNYAEAENESVGPGATVYSALEALRKRAGLQAGTDGTYGIGTGLSRIEMAFEEQRFFDIRRWEIAPTVMNQPRMGVSITNSNGSLTYNYVPVLTTKFVAPKMYYYPIPYDEVLKNPNLKQNPGW